MEHNCDQRDQELQIGGRETLSRARVGNWRQVDRGGHRDLPLDREGCFSPYERGEPRGDWWFRAVS